VSDFNEGERYIMVYALKYVHDLFPQNSMTHHAIGHMIERLEKKERIYPTEKGKIITFGEACLRAKEEGLTIKEYLKKEVE